MKASVKSVTRLQALLLAGLLGACAAGDDSTSEDTRCLVSLQPLLTTPDAAAESAALASPFPSDIYTVEADTPTGLRNATPRQGLLMEPSVNNGDGWAPHGPIRVEFNVEVDVESLPQTVTASTEADASLQLVALDTLKRVPFRIKHGQGVEPTRVYLVPFTPLREETTYAIVVQKGIRPSTGGNCTSASPTFASVLAGDDAGIPAHAAASIRESVTRLTGDKENGIQRSRLLLVAPYTTQSITRGLFERRAQVTASPIDPYGIEVFPALVTGGEFNPVLKARFPSLPSGLQFGVHAKLDNVAYVVLGNFDATDYQKNDKWSSAPQGTESLEFLLALPKLDAVEEPYRSALGSPARFPLVVFGHGLTACKETLLGVANTFARYGLAVGGIDVIEHGTRITDPFDSCGSGISEGMRFIRFADVEIARDNFRQTVLDEIQFVHMLASLPERDFLESLGTVTESTGRLKLDEIGYIGQSLGGILGTLLTTVEPRITASVLNVPGGGLTDFAVLADENAYSPLDLAFPDGLLFESMAGLQAVLGPADPLYYAPYATGLTPPTFAEQRPKNVLVQQGMEDGIVPNYLTENLGRALGAVQIEPVARAIEGRPSVTPPWRGEGEVTVAHQQYVMPEPNMFAGKNWDPHYLLILGHEPIVQAAQHQAARFLWTGIVEGKAEVIDGATAAD